MILFSYKHLGQEFENIDLKYVIKDRQWVVIWENGDIEEMDTLVYVARASTIEGAIVELYKKLKKDGFVKDENERKEKPL